MLLLNTKRVNQYSKFDVSAHTEFFMMTKQSGPQHLEGTIVADVTLLLRGAMVLYDIGRRYLLVSGFKVSMSSTMIKSGYTMRNA